MLMYDDLERKTTLAMPSHLSMFRSFDEVVVASNTFSEGRYLEYLEAMVGTYRGCLGLLHKLCSTNSTMEQLHKKLEFVEYLFRCSHNSTLFPRTECVELKPFG